MSTSDDDLAKLAALPRRANLHDPAPAAREAFENAFFPWHQRLLGRSTAGAGIVVVQGDGSLLARSVVPVLLAGVVAIYLLWAFSAVLALHG